MIASDICFCHKFSMTHNKRERSLHVKTFLFIKYEFMREQYLSEDEDGQMDRMVEEG